MSPVSATTLLFQPSPARVLYRQNPGYGRATPLNTPGRRQYG